MSKIHDNDFHLNKLESKKSTLEDPIDDSEDNPLHQIRIGSTIDALNGKFSGTVIEENITKFSSNTRSEKSMTGQSTQVFNQSMNKGSLGYRGSYGINGISKLNAAVNAYVGNSNADESKSICVDYNVSQYAGIEYIDFNNLSASDLLVSLSKNAQYYAISALDAYNKTNEFIEKNNINSLDDLNELNEEKRKELEDNVSEWADKVNDFYTNLGTGIVVGVLWGGIGTVTTKITSKKSDNVWKYGGDALFNYSAIANSTTIAMTYDGSKESKSTDVNIECHQKISAECVKNDTNEWFKTFAGKSFAEISDVKPLDIASFSISPPKIPDFEQPKAPEEITDKVEAIKNLKGLNIFATISAFNESKYKCIKNFIKDGKEPANKEPLLTIQNKIESNNINPLSPLDELDSTRDVSIIQKNIRSSTQKEDNLDKNYQPLGCWIANWSDLFPWLAIGVNNNINELGIGGVLSILKSRTFIQDLKALIILYQIASNGYHENITDRSKKYLEIANSFTSVLNNFINLKEHSQAAINNSFKSLSLTAQKIYKFWCDNPIFRSAELGFGVITNYTGSNEQYSITPNFSRLIENVFTGPNIMADMNSCELDPNRSCFSRFIKVLPIFEVDDNDKVIVKAIGPNSLYFSNVLHGDDRLTAFFMQESSGAQFKIKNNSIYTTSKYKEITYKTTLYPVPMSAATGIDDFIGQSVSTPLSTFESLNQQLESLSKQMDNMKAWSLSSSSWNENWNGDTPYSLRTLVTQYSGIVSQPAGIFTTNDSVFNKKELKEII